MNLINELNEKRYTLKGLSQTYYRNVMSAVREISRKGKLDIDTYTAHAENDLRLEYVSYDEFFELTQLQKRYEEEVKAIENGERPVFRRYDELWKNKMEQLTNKALIRNLAQNMCEDDTKAILGQNYLALANLGYNGKQDEGIPEIVRGNFNIFQRNKEKQEDIRILKEAIDRSILYILTVEPRSGIESQKFAIDLILSNKKPIEKIRSDLKLKSRAPFESYKEQFLEDFHNEQFKRAFGNFDVENEQQKIKDKAMLGMMEVDEKTYKRLSDLGYDGTKGHPLLKTGYRMYVDSYVFDKEMEYCLDVAESLSYKLFTQYNAVAEWATTNSTTRKNVDPMTNLIIDTLWRSTKSKYKRGKVDKERYDQVNELANEMDLAMHDEKIITAIGELKKVKKVNERNIPPSR